MREKGGKQLVSLALSTVVDLSVLPARSKFLRRSHSAERLMGLSGAIARQPLLVPSLFVVWSGRVLREFRLGTLTG